ncbi:MAG: hypothetical protein BWX45_00807 [Deltaproteobacteria bacterium ADurb.Bin002]|nr:MAG: hypothetical protein BWX45_00807 [Deltaproteobacteria bacterium ADurb.Bin002]
MRGLSAASRAGIENLLSFSGVDQIGNQLGRLILKAQKPIRKEKSFLNWQRRRGQTDAVGRQPGFFSLKIFAGQFFNELPATGFQCVGAGRQGRQFVIGGAQRLGFHPSENIQPFFDQPQGVGMKSGDIFRRIFVLVGERPGAGAAQITSQDGVDQPARRRLDAPGNFDRFIHDRKGRQPVAELELIQSRAQDIFDILFHFQVVAAIQTGQNPVQMPLHPQNAIDQMCEQAAVRRPGKVLFFKTRIQQIAGESVAL